MLSECQTVMFVFVWYVFYWQCLASSSYHTYLCVTEVETDLSKTYLRLRFKTDIMYNYPEAIFCH